MESRNRRGRAEQVAIYGMLLALALILGYVEALFLVIPGLPGVRLGLANLVLLGCLYRFPAPQVLLLFLSRILLSCFMFGSGMMLLYSLAGGMLSFLSMYAAKRTGLFSRVGASILGGVFHNLGQLLVAVLLLREKKLFWYFPVLLTAGALAGVLIGILSNTVEKHLPKSTHPRR